MGWKTPQLLLTWLYYKRQSNARISEDACRIWHAVAQQQQQQQQQSYHD